MIDAHHHLWDMSRLHYPWLATGGGNSMIGDFTPLCRDYLIEDYLRDMCGRVERSVHVQADHDPADPLAETRWLQSIADRPRSGGFPHAIVAFADFTRDDVADVLAGHAALANVRGVRQVLAHHPNPMLSHAPRDLIADPAWRARLALLRDFDLSFDLQVYPHQLAVAAALTGERPETLFLLNHAGSPVSTDPAGMADWREGMKLLAARPNVVVKISGFGMFDRAWTVDSIRPLVLETIGLFGVERCMFASNYPVESLARPFVALFEAYEALVADFSAEERAALFGGNAARCYRLDPPAKGPSR